MEGTTGGEGAESPVTGMESWYRLPAEEDSSGFAPMDRETETLSDQTAQQTAGEGKDGDPHSIPLEIQESGFSPCLPLLAAAQGQRFFDDTLYQQTEMDFAPLSGSLDLSEFPGQPSLQMSDAVALAGREVSVDNGCTVSRHSVSSSPGAAGEEGSPHDLSQHPLPERGDSADMSSGPDALHLALASADDRRPSSRGELERAFDRGDGSFLESSMTAPELLALLEKDVGVWGSSAAASGSSSSRTVSSKETESADPPTDRGALDTRVLNDRALNTEGEGFRDASEVLFFNTEPPETPEDPGEFSQLEASGITLRTSMRRPAEPGRGDLHKKLCSEIQQRHQEKELLKASGSRETPNVPPVPAETSPESSHLGEPAKLGDQSGVSGADLSASSRCSIERGHKDTGISPADGFSAGDASFVGRLAQPISQSTPGALPAPDVRKQLAGRLMEIKAKLTGSQMSLNEEPSGRSSAGNVAAHGKPQSAESSQGYPESSDSQRSSSPQRRRIQSLPSLNYIEKVGTWNTNQSFDALVLRGLTGVSPKKKAYHAVADSLNRMLSKQVSSAPPKRGPAAPFTAASSMTNLTGNEKETSGSSALTRSQSYNLVIAAGAESGQPPAQPPAQPVERDGKEYSEALRSSESLAELREKRIGDSPRASGAVGDAAEEKDDGRQERDDSVTRKQTELGESVAQPAGRRITAPDLGRHAHGGANTVTLGRFSDVSLDSDLFSSSRSSEPAIQVSMDSAAVHSLTSLEVDNFVPVWSPTAKTPDQSEINIEERIPTYLRNLGIEQSPGAILTSFSSNGPIREPEFSPSELRTIKGSTATPTRSMRLSEGGSQSAANVSQSSVYSTASTASVSVPMGSEAGPESPVPAGVSQYDAASYPGHRQLPPVHSHGEDAKPEASAVSSLNVPPPPEEDSHLVELKRVKQLIQQFESRDVGPNQTLEEAQADLTSLLRASEAKPATDSTNDSFIGSKTLKEIRKLLAEADSVGLGDVPGLDPPPIRDFDDLSTRIDKSDSSWLENPSRGLLAAASWGDSLNSDVTRETPLTDSDWGRSLARRDPVRSGFDPEDVKQPQRRAGRSGPEGSNGAAEDSGLPDTQRRTSRSKDGPRDFTGEAGPPEDLLGRVNVAVGGLEKALAAAGYPRGSEEVPESDDGSADSLATRVKSLLRSAVPFTQTAQSGERPRGSMKLRLAGDPPADAELSEEDRKRIEEIKRELLEGAKRERLAEPPRLGNVQEDGGWRDADKFRLRITPSPVLSQPHDAFLEPPVPGDGGYIPRGGLTAFINMAAANALYTEPTGTSQSPDRVMTYDVVKRESSWGNETDAHGYSNEDVNKPISSITFASRRRLSPLSSSVEYLEPALHDVAPARGGGTSAGHPGLGTESAEGSFRSNYEPDVRSHGNTPLSPFPTEDVEERRRADRFPPQPSTADGSGVVVSRLDGSRPTGPPCHEAKPGGVDISRDLPPLRRAASAVEQDPDGGGSRWLSTEKLSDGDVGARPSPAKGFAAGSSSPPRKALSCIHVTLSPKQDVRKTEVALEAPVAEATLETSEGKRWVDRVIRSEPAENERPPRGKAMDLSDNSYYLHPPAGGKKSATPAGGGRDGRTILVSEAKKRWPLSDAATQITTESPQKTTFSAEIFIDGNEEENTKSRSSQLETEETPERLPAHSPRFPHLHRAADQPLLLPYRPPGSPGLFYVPYLEGSARVSPTSTVESSHPGSIDAVSPKFPAEVLGSAAADRVDAGVPRHSRGIYSTRAEPEITRRGSSARDKKPSPDVTDNVELPAKLQPSSTPTARTLSRQGPESHFGSYIEPSHESLRDKSLRSRAEPRARARNLPEESGASYPEENDFFPLKPEPDYSRGRRGDFNQKHKKSEERPGGREASAYEPLRLGRPEVRGHITDRTLKESPYDPARLEAWGLRESQKSTRSETAAGGGVCTSQTYEVPERLEKTGSTASDQSLDDLWARFTDGRKNQRSESSNNLEMSLLERLDRLARLVKGSRSVSLASERDERVQKTTKSGEDVTDVKKTEERWYQTKPEEGRGGISARPARRPFGEKFHDGPVESNSGTESTAAETETATQTDSESASESASSSISTIDTERLIRAFGPERVRPSAKLSHLYSAIDLQKKRRETSTRKQSRPPGAKEFPQGERSEFLKRLKTTASGSTSGSSWEPSAAPRSKRNGKLSKGIQTGDLEIVTGATRKNTRDVGTTFPSPRGEQRRPNGEPPASGPPQSDEPWSHRPWWGAGQIPQGVSWFVPAEDLKSAAKTGPALAWYEPVPKTKPWRQPLREKHLQEESAGRSGRLPNGPRRYTETENRSPAPFVKVTLQEWLETRRPDFIFRSGERVKRLQLLAKERRIQRTFQNQRDELFNPPATRGDGRHRDVYNGAKTRQRDRAIPKKEMVERSKRIYQQLPEIRKKKAEEKRRSEYEENRMKAQLFKKKVTNQVLGRKTPWN